MRSGLVVCVLIGTLVACATKTRVPRVIEVLELRGQSYAQVVKAIGEPSDRHPNGATYWFLSEDSKNNPSPTPVLYKVLFADDKLVSIERASK